MNDKELEEEAKNIAKAVNDGELKEAVRILRGLTSGDTKTTVPCVVPPIATKPSEIALQ